MAEADDFDDDVPPLEDFSHILSNRSAYQLAKESVTEASALLNEHANGDDSRPQKPFMGMKKGFLCSSTTSTPPHRKKPEAVPLKPQQDDSSVLNQLKNVKIDDEDESTKNREWLTDEVLGQVQDDEDLKRQLADPAFMRVIERFRTDPDTAKKLYGTNAEVQQFFAKMFGVLGKSFCEIAQNSEQNDTSKPDLANNGIQISETREAEKTVKDSLDEKAEEIIKRPEIREILTNRDIQDFLQLLRNNPNLAMNRLRTADETFQRNVRTLVDNGLLSFA